LTGAILKELTAGVDVVLYRDGRVEEARPGSHGPGAFELPRDGIPGSPVDVLKTLYAAGTRTVLLPDDQELVSEYVASGLVDRVLVYLTPSVASSTKDVIPVGFRIAGVDKTDEHIRLEAVPPTPIIDRFGAKALYKFRGDLLSVYAEVYADRLGDPFFSVARYWERLEAYARRDGFSLVTCRMGGELAGYALGYTLPAGSGWWQGFRGDIDPSDLNENGHRTFALTEIMVRARWRRRGCARAMHDALLAGRGQERATLLVLPGNVPARNAYESWGWQKLGVLQPFEDAPVYDSMVLRLR